MMTTTAQAFAGLVIVALFCDVVTTLVAFHRGAQELNPIMALFMRKIGLVPALVFTHVALGVYVFFDYANWQATTLFYMAVGLWLVVAFNIWQLLRKPK